MKFLLSGLVFILFSASFVNAAPTISGVSTVLFDGQSVAIELPKFRDLENKKEYFISALSDTRGLCMALGYKEFIGWGTFYLPLEELSIVVNQGGLVSHLEPSNIVERIICKKDNFEKPIPSKENGFPYQKKIRMNATDVKIVLPIIRLGKEVKYNNLKYFGLDPKSDTNGLCKLFGYPSYVEMDKTVIEIPPPNITRLFSFRVDDNALVTSFKAANAGYVIYIMSLTCSTQ